MALPAAAGAATRRDPDHGRELAGLGRGGFASLVGAVVSAVTGFALVVAVARGTDPYRAGIFFGVTSLFLMLEAVLRLGSDIGAIYFIARWRALGQGSRIRPGLRVALAPVLVASLLGTLVLNVAAPQIDGLIGDEHHSSITLIRLLGALLPVATVYDVLLGATRGLGSMRATVLIEKIVRPVLQIALVVLVLAIGWRAGLGYAWGLPYVAVFAAAWLSLRKLLRRLVPAAKNAVVRVPKMAREYWQFTWPRALASGAQIIVQRLDIVLVAVMQGAREAAIYTAATRFLVVGQFISQAIAAPVQPRLSAALAEDDKPRASALYRVSTCWIVLISWPVFTTAAVFAPVYLRLFGHNYQTGLWVVVILSASMLVGSGVGVVDAVVIMAGRSSWNLWTTLGAMVINVGVDVLLIPRLGILGAAIGWCAAILASNVVPLLLAWRGVGLHPFGRSVFGAYLVSAFCFGALPLLGRLISPAGAAAGLGAGAVLFALALYRWRVDFHLLELLRVRRRAQQAVAE